MPNNSSYKTQKSNTQTKKVEETRTIYCENISYMLNIITREKYINDREKYIHYGQQDVLKYYDLLLEPFIGNNNTDKKKKSEILLNCKNQFEHNNRTKAFEQIFDIVLCEDFETERVAICLGEENVSENSISIHPSYGIAYIPSSSIKGFFKAYIKNFTKTEDSTLLDELFGTEERRGFLVFDDAFPINNYEIELFMSAFTNKTYFKSDGSEMLFNEKIDVLKYPTVINSRFNFRIYNSKNKEIKSGLLEKLKNIYENQIKDIECSCKATNPEDFNELIKNLFTNALYFQGIGAKTSVGFGSFKIAKS